MSQSKWVVAVAGWGVLLALLGAALPATAAEEAPKADKLTERIRSGRIRFEMVQGRITGWSQGGGSYSTESSSGDRREKLSIRYAPNSINLTYELTTPAETLTVASNAPGHVQIGRTPAGDSTLLPIEFAQIPGESLKLTVGADPEKKVYRAATFWHLMLTEPEVSRRYLVPLLQLLQPNTDLAKAVAEVEKELLGLAEEGLPDRQTWAGHVAQLADDRFSKRQAADRELRQAGALAMVYLRSLDPGKLDAEQRFRIRRILAARSSNSVADTPPRVAGRMAGNAKVWLELLGRPEISTRQTAAQWLQWILEEPVDFDPAGDAAARQRQIEQLRAKLAGSGDG